jgi:hypothetical protein
MMIPAKLFVPSASFACYGTFGHVNMAITQPKNHGFPSQTWMGKAAAENRDKPKELPEKNR